MATHDNKQNDMAEVWLVSDAHSFRAMHDMIAVVRPDGSLTVYECDDQGFDPEKPIAALLGAAGFSGSHHSPVKVRTANAATGAGFVRHRGFRVPADQLAEVEMMIKIALAGNLGGFTGVHMGQIGFHRSVFALEYAWLAAGMPQTMIVHPNMGGSSEGDGAPGSIFLQAVADPRILDTLLLAGELPEPEETQA